eukprot:102113-Prorocentrum_minimum.AAC.2
MCHRSSSRVGRVSCSLGNVRAVIAELARQNDNERGNAYVQILLSHGAPRRVNPACNVWTPKPSTSSFASTALKASPKEDVSGAGCPIYEDGWVVGWAPSEVRPRPDVSPPIPKMPPKPPNCPCAVWPRTHPVWPRTHPVWPRTHPWCALRIGGDCLFR